MKTYIISLLLLAVFISRTVAQENLVEYKEITFSSDLEKKILDDHFLNKQSDHFLLFMASGNLLKEGSVMEAKERFYSHLTAIEADKFDVKKNPKKVKQLYDDLHKTFLAKYEVRNRFEDIFHNGYYNCVSASALFGLAFEKLNIPFTVKEKPTHVYLVAYPEADKIMVETTNPIGGSVIMNQNFQQNFLRVLKEQKIISAQEYSTTDSKVLFDRYFFGKQENISLIQLIGLQYVNEAIFKLEEERFLEAFQMAEKGYLFYPSERSGYLLMLTAYETFKRREQKDTVHAACLAKLSRYKKLGITSEMVQGEFASVIQKLLFDKGEKEKLAEYHHQLQSFVLDESLRQELKFLYNYENGRLLYNKARFRESLEYFEECLKIKPKNDDVNQLLIACISQSSRNKFNKEMIKFLEEYSVKYPVLLENNMFTEMLGSGYLKEMEINFETQRATEGEKYKTLFESFYAKNKDVNYDPYLLAQAYSAAAVYYFRKNQTSKAKGVIAKGLEISPNNYELQIRQKMIH